MQKNASRGAKDILSFCTVRFLRWQDGRNFFSRQSRIPAVRIASGVPITEPFVTIVIPTFKRDTLLLRAAASAVAWRGVRIEHVIVGNTCPLLPGLEPALRKINPEVKILHMPRWDNPIAAFTPALTARARNAGINAASGSFVAQLDSDNTLDPDHAASLAACIEAVPGRLVATCGRKFFFSDRRPCDLPYHPCGSTLEEAAATWKRFEKAGIYEARSNLA